MTTAYDPDLIDRLVREARPGDFDVNELTSWALDCRDSFPVTAPAAERILRRLTAMADQLEAARQKVAAWRRKAEVALKLFGETQAEVERLEALVSVSPDDIRDVVVENVRMHEAFDQAMKKLRAGSVSVRSAMCTWCGQHWPMLDGEPIEVFRRYTNEHANQCPANDIRIERDAMRPVVEAADAHRTALDNGTEDEAIATGTAVDAAIDAYRAAKDKT